MVGRKALFLLLIFYLTKVYGGLEEGYTMEQAERREPMPEYPSAGEITFKLHAKWDENLLNENSASFKILEGNVRKAISSVVGEEAELSNVYFRRGYLGMQTSQPVTVAHLMVNGGSDTAGMIDQAVRPDDTLGDGLKVYKDSFNAY